MNTTYSFQDVNCVLAHPSVGQHIVNGSGAKSITISRSNDMASHDLAADGSVMTNKMPSPNGLLTVVVQQTSPAHDYLVRLSNYLNTSSTSEFARGSVTINAPSMGVSHICTGVTIQKQPDKAYAASGGDVSWVLMAARITDGVI